MSYNISYDRICGRDLNVFLLVKTTYEKCKSLYQPLYFFILAYIGYIATKYIEKKDETAEIKDTAVLDDIININRNSNFKEGKNFFKTIEMGRNVN